MLEFGVLLLILLSMVTGQHTCNQASKSGFSMAKKLLTCCKSENLVDDSVVLQCKKDSLKTFEAQKSFGKCVLTEIGFIKDEIIDKEAAFEYLTNRSNGDSDLLEHWKSSLNICFADIDATEDSGILNMVANSESQKGFWIMFCMSYNIIKSCPSSIWCNDSECNAWTANTHNCGFNIVGSDD